MPCQCLLLKTMLSLPKQFWSIKPSFLVLWGTVSLEFWVCPTSFNCKNPWFWKVRLFELFFELKLYPQVLKYWLYWPILTSGIPKFFSFYWNSLILDSNLLNAHPVLCVFDLDSSSPYLVFYTYSWINFVFCIQGFYYYHLSC